MRIFIVVSLIFLFHSCDKNHTYLFEANKELGDSLFLHFPSLNMFDSYSMGLKYKENLNIESYCGAQLIVDVSSKEMGTFLNFNTNKIISIDSLRNICGKIDSVMYIDQAIWNFQLYGREIEMISYKYSLLNMGSYKDSLKFYQGISYSEQDMKILYWTIIK
jgi:hypothetical protein